MHIQNESNDNRPRPEQPRLTSVHASAKLWSLTSAIASALTSVLASAMLWSLTSVHASALATVIA